MTADFKADLQNDVPLASRTTLGVGGPARRLASVMFVDELRAALAYAKEQDLPTLILGGGSNMLVSDAGFAGLAISIDFYKLEVEYENADTVRVRAGAGVEWDELVTFCVTDGFAGIECLAGIPGRVGAAPIQNIGAYGQEVSTTIDAVHVVDRKTLVPQRFPATACEFGYRSSKFKGEWKDRYAVTEVEFLMRRGGPATVAYEELRRTLGVTEGGAPPPIAAVSRTVRKIRARKSMVLDDRDPNRRSAGSFFVNPIVSPAEVARIRNQLDPQLAESMPSWSTDDGRIKLSAAWLIQNAGFDKGFSFGRAGLSSRHTLALINRGGATARDLLALATMIRKTVRNTYGVELTPEPVFVGFDAPADQILG